MANINIPNPIWDSPEKLLKDFETFVAEQEPKRVTVLKNVKTKDDWSVQEVETVKEQGLVTISQFAAWKKIHRTTLNTGYSTGDYKPVYDLMLSICEAYSERRLYGAERNAANIIFAMKNSYGWVDKTETELSGGLNTPLSDEAKAYLAKATRSEDKGFEEDEPS